MSANPKTDSWPLLDDVLAKWSSRKVLTGAQYDALSAAAKRRAFSISGAWETKFVVKLQAVLRKAIAGNLSSADWMAEAQKVVDAFGGGKKLALYSGEHFSPAYAETVFRTNVSTALAAGRYADMFSPAGMRQAGYVMLSAVHDARNETDEGCPGTICRALDGKVFRKDDPAVGRILTPLHFGCRCTVIELDEEDVAAGGYEIADWSDFGDLLGAAQVWGDDKLDTLLGAGSSGLPAPMLGVDVTGFEGEPTPEDVWGTQTMGHDQDPVSFLTEGGFDAGEVDFMRSAVRFYTSSEYAPWNAALRQSGGNFSALQAWDRDQILAINTYLDSVPPFPAGTLFRVADLPASEAARLETGHVFESNSLFSTTSSEKVAEARLRWDLPRDEVRVEFRVMKSQSGRSIASWSTNEEAEVLFKIGTEFRIRSVEKLAAGGGVPYDRLLVMLEEV